MSPLILLAGAAALVVCAGLGDGHRKVLLNAPDMLPELTILVMYVAFAGASSLVAIAILGLPDFSGVHWAAWGGFLIGMPLMLWTYYRGIQMAGLTLVVPVMAFAPATSMLGEWVLLGAVPSRWYFLGVLVAALGGYLLGVAELRRARRAGEDASEQGSLMLAPLKALVSNRGVRSVGYAVLGFFLVGPWQKLAFMGFAVDGAVSLSAMSVLMLAEALACGMLFAVVLWLKRAPVVATLRKTPVRLFLNAGVPWALHLWLLYVGFAVTLPSYVLTVRSMGIVVTTVFAARVLKEPWRQRVPAMSVIVLGVTVVSLWG